jgi:hypothetical protein
MFYMFLLLYQNNQVKYNNLAISGSLVTPKQLTATDAEYQFLYPTGASEVYLPNGTGLYIGKKFTIANMGSDTIHIRKSGTVSDLLQLQSLKNGSIIHAGDNNWVRISMHTGGISDIGN